MKIKMTLIIIAVLVVALIGVGFAQSSKLKNIHIQRSVTIDGTMQEVFDQVVYLNNFPNWSPFKEADPEQEVSVKGTDGTVGAQFHWIGNKGKDVGHQEIAEIKTNEYVRMQCDIQKPFVAKPSFEYSFSEKDGKVTVTQDFKLKSGAVDAFFMWVFGAKKDMAKMNERGLELLKLAVEK